MPDTFEYTSPQPQENYQNPTAVTPTNEQFGTSDQFNIDPFMQPFGFEQQRAEGADFRQRFSTFLGEQETPEATRQRFENRYGYQPLREEYLRTGEALGDIGSAIRARPQEVLSRGRETLMTQAQTSKITNAEVGELMKTYSALGQINEQQGKRLAMVEQNMNDAAKLEMAQQQKMATPWLQEYQDKNILQAREFSGWTFASQLELNRLMANQQAGYNWTNAESTRAHELSMQENGFNNQLNLLEKQNEFALDLWG